jgi:hypothetical protein
MVLAMTAIHLAFLNKSSLLTASDMTTMAIACANQARNHACPIWGWELPQISFLPDESFIKPDMDLLYFFDNSDAASALGYHDLTVTGAPYAKVFVKDTLDNGSAVSITASHEALELLGDPTCDQFRPAPDGFEYALEMSDACEEFSYDLDGVQVSDFLLPAFWNLPNPPNESRFSYTGRITAAFQTGAGGYQIRRDPKTGVTSQVFGEKRADWRNAGKSHPAARTARRMRA